MHDFFYYALLVQFMAGRYDGGLHQLSSAVLSLSWCWDNLSAEDRETCVSKGSPLGTQERMPVFVPVGSSGLREQNRAKESGAVPRIITSSQ